MVNKKNVGFRIAVDRKGFHAVAELLGITVDAVRRIYRGENNLKLDHAAKIHDNFRIKWQYFREWE